MPMSIRDPRAAELAKKLAARRNVTMTAAIIQALEAELARDERPLAERVQEIVDDLKRIAGPNGRVMSKDEIDAMWTD